MRVDQTTAMALACLLLAVPATAQCPEGIACDPEPTNMVITYGNVVTCSISPAGDTDSFTFAGVEGERVIILASTTGGVNFQACIQLFDPAGVSVATACGLSVFNRIDRTLLQTGNYRVEVFDQPGAVASGSYTLTLERVAPPSSTSKPIQFGGVQADSICPAGDMDGLFFSGTAGDGVDILVSSTGGVNFQPCIELFAPDGTRLQVACALALSNRITTTLTQSGLHTIVVYDQTSSFGAIASGNYSLALQCLSGPCVVPSPVLSISPSSGKYTTRQNVDLTVLLESQGLSVTGGSVTIDGIDYTSVFLSGVVGGTLALGGQSFRFPDVPLRFLGPGVHTTTVLLSLSDGTNLADTVVWDVRGATEP